MPDKDNLPLPEGKEEQNNFIHMYTKLALILSSLDRQLFDIKKEVEPLHELAAIVMKQLVDAGIKLTDADSVLGLKLADIKTNNKEWKNESSNIIKSLSSINTKFWGLITILTIAVGLGIFNIFKPDAKIEVIIPDEIVKVVKEYHMPANTEWKYNENGMLWTIVENDTLYKKP